MTIARLIENVAAARAHHDFLFDENDQGRAPDSAVQDAVTGINDAFLALCHARPVEPAEQQLRADYLNAELFDYIEGCDSITTACIAALVEPTVTDQRKLPSLFDAHRAAWSALNAACKVTDDAFGTDAEDAAEAAQEVAGEAAADALHAILTYRFETVADVKVAVQYLAEHHRKTGDGDPSAWFLTLACQLAEIEEDGL